jgi:predicted metal-dependent hydrolase
MVGMVADENDDTQTVAKPPVILAFVTDLFFASKIEAAAKTLEFQIEWLAPDEDLLALDPSTTAPDLAEHVNGPGFVLLEKITLLQPALLVFDLSDRIFPWRKWLPMIKSAPATRRIPVLCFGSHVDGDTLMAARSAGAELVLARSAFTKDLPEILRRTARVPDVTGIHAACRESLSRLATRGLEEFNRGEYFQAHETLEEAWKLEPNVGRELYRAILQVAVTYLQIERGNYRGAMKMSLRLRQWIDPLPDHCRGVDIAALRSDVAVVHEELSRIGESGIQNFDRGLMKPVVYQT